MILDKKDLPDDPTPPDAPPSYDDLARDGELQSMSGPTGPGRFGRFWRFGDEKRGIGEVVGEGSSSASASASSSSVTVPGPSRVGGQNYPFRSSSSSTSPSSQQQPNRPSKVTKQKSKQPAGLSWIANLTSSHRDAEAQKDVRATVLDLVRDLVQNAPTGGGGGGSVAAEGILQSCQVACDGCALSLSDVLQERSIEGHTPLYWAIVKRPRSSRTDDEDRPSFEKDTLLHLLLSHTAPLNASTLSELRLACLVTADNALLQRLRTDPAVVPRSGVEAMLHSSASPLSPSSSNSRESLVLVDEVEVFEDTGEEGDKVGAFMVKMKIRRFQRRMRVAGGVGVEFVARGRLWFLTFFIVPHPTQLTSLPSSDSYSNTNSQPPTMTSPPAHPLDPTHLAHASISHTLLTRAKSNNRRTNSATLGVGSWAVALGLMEHGAACYVDGRVKVDEWDWEREEESMRREREEKARREKERIEREERDLEEGEKVRLGKLIDVGLDDGMTIVSTSSGSTNVTPNHTGTSQQSTLPPHQINQNQRRKRSKPKPTIVLALRTPKDEQLTVPPAPIYSGDERRRAKDRESKEREKEARMRMQVCAMAGFEESLMGGSLQFDGSTYIAPDETLHATLEAKLARPDAECVIC